MLLDAVKNQGEESGKLHEFYPSSLHLGDAAVYIGV